MDFSNRTGQAGWALVYNFNFPHVPFGTICND